MYIYIHTYIYIYRERERERFLTGASTREAADALTSAGLSTRTTELEDDPS